MSVTLIYGTTDVLHIHIDDELEFIGGRVSRGSSGLYYKGAGTVYQGHHVLDPTGFSNARPADVFYYGYSVCEEKYRGMFGIFTWKMQPFFSDFVGSCGPKELKIVKHSELFEKSSVRVENVTKWSELSGGQYYFTLRYDCGRKKYVEDPHPYKLLDLLEYMVANDWCVPWDKGFISDVTYDGRISDVADMFRSKLFKHKLGTVYAALYSLWKKDQKLLKEVSNIYKWGSTPTHDGLWTAVYIATLACAIIGYDRYGRPKVDDAHIIGKELIRDILIKGRNCAGVEDVQHGIRVAKEYRKKYTEVHK